MPYDTSNVGRRSPFFVQLFVGRLFGGFLGLKCDSAGFVKFGVVASNIMWAFEV